MKGYGAEVIFVQFSDDGGAVTTGCRFKYTTYDVS